MLRSPAHLCLRCELRLLTTSPAFFQGPPWNQLRTYAQAQKRRPARLELSRRVAQPPTRATPSGRPVKRRTNSPFAAMNQTQARLRDEPRRASPPEWKRSTGKSGKKEPRKRTEGEYKALKMQRALSNVGYGTRSAIKSDIASVGEFDQFDLLPSIKESLVPQALKGAENSAPTPVQRIAIPALLGSKPKRSNRPMIPASQMEQFLLAAETGSGKTLAYLLPIIDAIKRTEAAEETDQVEDQVEEQERKKQNMFELPSPPLSNAANSTAARPRAIILVPTAELVDQVTSTAKSLSHTVKFRAAGISAAYSATVIRNRLFSPNGVDILISTPHLLYSITENDPNVLSRVTHLVCDEADSLFDRSFAPLTAPVIDRSSPSLQQLILCSATIPRSLDTYLRKRFPDIRRLVTPNLHAIPRRIQLGVVDVMKDPFRGNKNLACADAIWAIGKSATEHAENEAGERSPIKRVAVFVNEREKAVEVAAYLVSKGIDAVPLSRDTADQRKSGEILAAFTGGAEGKQALEPEGKKGAQPTRRLPNTKVLVMTDLGARGIDTTAVRHVILYDVPHSTIDFIHRLGRTGRMGRRGRGIVLVGKGDRSDVVKEVREGMFRGQALI